MVWTWIDRHAADMLIRVLSPWTEPVRIQAWVEHMRGDADSWQALFALASAQWCAPLLYEVLRKHGCLDAVPDPVRSRLRTDCLENRLRNQLLETELAELLLEFSGAGIKVVLLKGAATFSDDLYGSLGARTMLDLDLLVRPDKIAAACSLLIAAGYEEIPDEGKVFAGIPTDRRHAHINGYHKPGSPVQVELHYNIAYGQGGRILSAEVGWRQISSGAVGAASPLILQPTYRLIHNTVHGLIPSRDYIKGEIRLWHILEFAWLAKRYWHEIDWRVWLEAARREKYTTAFLAWVWMAHRMFTVPLPEEIVVGWWPRLQGERLLSATLVQFRRQCLGEAERLHWRERLLWGLHRLYYWAHLPGWVWRNVCYAEGWKNFPVRVRYFAAKVMSRRSWGKV